jgi:hypothetical protein
VPTSRARVGKFDFNPIAAARSGRRGSLLPRSGTAAESWAARPSTCGDRLLAAGACPHVRTTSDKLTIGQNARSNRGNFRDHRIARQAIACRGQPAPAT